MSWGHRCLPWPQNLTPAQRLCIEAVKQHGAHADAAASIGIAVGTLQKALAKARRRAQVATQAELIERYDAVGHDEDR